MPYRNRQQEETAAPLSFITDSHGHRIERYPGNVLIISGAPKGDAHKEVSEWYWRVVGVKE